MFDRRLVQYFDWWLLGLTLLIGGIGLIVLYSAVTAGAAQPETVFCIKQASFFGIGLMVMLASLLVNYKELDQWGEGIYLITILLLVAVLFYGKFVAGSRRWLVLGPITMQPSEIVKISVAIMLAKYYSKKASLQGFTLRELARPMAIVIIPFLLIVRQPDLGTALLVVLIAASITVYVKIDIGYSSRISRDDSLKYSTVPDRFVVLRARDGYGGSDIDVYRVRAGIIVPVCDDDGECVSAVRCTCRNRYIC